MLSSPFVGEIRIFAGNFAPAGWAFCNGLIMPIAQNDVLYSLIGTTYGGDGQSTFALPDLRGRVPVHQGQGPGPSNYISGQVAGTETVTVAVGQLPVHAHSMQGASGAGSATDPAGSVWAASAAVKQFAPGSEASVAMSPGAIGAAGGGQPHDNMSPYLAINFIIALNGIFPSRS